jgi:signal transduction histidine kinase/FixJ family two-component response regulator
MATSQKRRAGPIFPRIIEMILPSYDKDMSMSQERILIVEGNPEISDLIARQALKPLGYRVKVIQEAPKAIQEAIRFVPDILIVNLKLTGLSGKDLLVALSSQGMAMPVIVIAEQGMENDVIQAFRLGATDYLGWPIRETEVVSAVERALTQVRNMREREALARKVEKTNLELQSRVRELTTIMGIGKAVTSITDRHVLFDKIIEGAVFVAEADKGWLVLREGNSKIFSLSAQCNLPQALAFKIDQPWDDGISSLVALSGESLSIHGAPLSRFIISRLGNSALVVPLKIKKEVVGLMVVMRDEPKPFSPSNRILLETLADYASISLVNVRLFQAVEERAISLLKVAEASRESEKLKSEILQKVREELENPLVMISQEVEVLASGQEHPLDQQQLDSIQAMRSHLKRVVLVINGLSLLEKVNSPTNLMTVNLVDLARQAISRFQGFAQENLITINQELPSEPVFITVDTNQISQLFDLLLSNAIRMSSKGKVVLNVNMDQTGCPHVSIQDSGPGISEEDQAKLFHPFVRFEPCKPDDQEHIGLGLALGKEIIKAYGGRLWVESKMGRGSIFHFTLKPAN